MKPLLKVLSFLAILFLLDFLLRKGLIGHFLPFSLPMNLNVLLLYSAFAGCAWFVTKRFASSDQMSLKDLGISFSKRNRFDFWVGFLVGVVLWGIVAISQSLFAGFSWVLRPDFNAINLAYGIILIFIADLGTELFTRGYPLIKLEKGFGAKAAIAIMVVVEVVKSFAFNLGSDVLLYAVLIPVLHIVFFSIIYFKTRRLGASLGIHTGANFITISIFDLRVEEPGQAIPAGLFQSSSELETLSVHALQLPWVGMAALFSIATYIWWERKGTATTSS